MPANVSETAILAATREVLDAVAKRMKKERDARIAIIGYVDGNGKMNHAATRERSQIAAQRAVNSKAYLVKQHRINAGRILVRVGRGQSGVAEIILLPESGENGAESPWLQETLPIDENVTKPLESDLMLTPETGEHTEGSSNGQEQK